MILAQLSDPHIVAAGKLFRCPMQGTAPDAERAWLEFDTAPYLARAVASLNALVPRPDVTVVTGDLVTASLTNTNSCAICWHPCRCRSS